MDAKPTFDWAKPLVDSKGDSHTVEHDYVVTSDRDTLYVWRKDGSYPEVIKQKEGEYAIRNVPEPKYIPFTLDTLPPINQIELRRIRDGARSNVFFACDDRVHCGASTQSILFSDALLLYEFRLNGGDWQPFGQKVED